MAAYQTRDQQVETHNHANDPPAPFLTTFKEHHTPEGLQQRHGKSHQSCREVRIKIVLFFNYG